MPGTAANCSPQWPRSPGRDAGCEAAEECWAQHGEAQQQGERADPDRGRGKWPEPGEGQGCRHDHDDGQRQHHSDHTAQLNRRATRLRRVDGRRQWVDHRHAVLPLQVRRHLGGPQLRADDGDSVRSPRLLAQLIEANRKYSWAPAPETAAERGSS
jgi:hypothetical protein